MILRPRRLVSSLLAVGGLVFILAATLTPVPWRAASAAATPLLCLWCGEQGSVDVTLNVLLFIPFAFGLRLWGVAARRVVVASLLLSLLVESLQYAVVIGRDSSLSDVLTNTLGGALGAVLAGHLDALVRPCPQTARRLAIAWTAFWLGTTAVAALALRPWGPHGPLLTQWARERPPHPPFDGRVTAASLGGAPLPEGWRPVEAEPPLALRAGTARLRVSVITGNPAEAWRPILHLWRENDEVLGFSQWGHALVFESPSRAVPMRFRPVAVSLEHAFPTDSGVPLDLTAEVERETIRLGSSWSGGRSRALTLSPSFGWSLVLPFDYALGPEVHLITALWLAGFLFPLGRWWGRAGLPPLTAIGLIAGVIVVGLGVLPRLAGYPPVHWSEWIASAMGAALGWARSGRAAYLSDRCDSPSIGAFSSS
ncbi:MAG: VanZ family protein [Gemmatimonadales bacterium]